MIDIKVCNTEDLRTLARDADRARLNRRVTPEFLDSLDPEGGHVVSRLIYGMNDSPIHRCRVLAKVVGSDEPIIVELDVAGARYDRLLSADDFIASMKEGV